MQPNTNLMNAGKQGTRSEFVRDRSTKDSKLLEIVNSDLKDWSRIKTSVKGLFLIKIKDKLLVEANPTDEYGQPTKKRGTYVRSVTDLDAIREILNNGKVKELLERMDQTFGQTETIGEVII